ncbi:hypothetical protein [Vibrio parahaemolyticus]|uniref:hypothetical protein n=1 Tax=Vibrio parahaemolyticus TaxID=670 RepID=UPI00110FFA76|nr:hypothetical protein [Vibrio parahaemolyticus]MDG2761596.1 hypothetical protein [Vibrio parahaemolyticus]TMX40847.1 hypothetical protein DA098_03180 [Vibrio parahaemolyticus]TMX79848.1 hypothetical protein DA094_05020 [Vibrio parahaemolyticus]
MILLDLFRESPQESWIVITYLAVYAVQLYENRAVRKFHQNKAAAYMDKLVREEVNEQTEIERLISMVSDHALINHATSMMKHGVDERTRYQILAGIYSGEFLQ